MVCFHQPPLARLHFFSIISFLWIWFSFVAFLTQDSQMQESSMLQCNVNLCAVADNNCVINTVDSECPNEINYKYTVNGSNWKFWSFLFRKINFINYYYVNFLLWGIHVFWIIVRTNRILILKSSENWNLRLSYILNI